MFNNLYGVSSYVWEQMDTGLIATYIDSRWFVDTTQ